MAYTVIVHIANEDAFVAEIEELPSPTDNVLWLRHFRQKDGKPVRAFDHEAVLVAYPWSRVNFVEVLAERGSRDELYEFFREE